jgi:hypothetical protein
MPRFTIGLCWGDPGIVCTGRDLVAYSVVAVHLDLCHTTSEILGVNSVSSALTRIDPERHYLSVLYSLSN